MGFVYGGSYETTGKAHQAIRPKKSTLFAALPRRATINMVRGNPFLRPQMTRHIKALVLLFMLSLGHAVPAQEAVARQDHVVLRKTVEQFLQTQSAGLPGKATITVGSIDLRLSLPGCAAPEAFLPPGGRAWGKTTVGVRCTVPAPWKIYIAATVRVQGDYIAAAAPLAQGQSIGPNDITKVKGDLTSLPAGVITDPSQAVGRTLSISLPPGAPLRQDALRNQQAIQQGQTVRVVSSGPGFSVSSEARALNNANDGQITQARTGNGQIVRGVARMGGVVEVTY
jgi:flagella basal body P-ring formation protein FlgA